MAPTGPEVQQNSKIGGNALCCWCAPAQLCGEIREAGFTQSISRMLRGVCCGRRMANGPHTQLWQGDKEPSAKQVQNKIFTI